jgi:hypothetical protein
VPSRPEVRSSGSKFGSGGTEIGHGIQTGNVEASGGDGFGVKGNSDNGVGVDGRGGKTGVRGGASPGIGVRGFGGRGGVFTGSRANVRLKPSKDSTHPARGKRGDLFVDKGGRLWFCKGNTRWRQVA